MSTDEKTVFGKIVFPNPFGYELPSSEEVDNMQKKYGFSDEYADFLKIQNGFDEEKWSKNGGKGSKYFIPSDIDEEDGELSEEFVRFNDCRRFSNRMVPDRLTTYFFPIADDKGGNPFVEILAGKYRGYIGKLDHEIFPGSDVPIEEYFEDIDDMTEGERADYFASNDCGLLYHIVARSIKDFINKLRINDGFLDFFIDEKFYKEIYDETYDDE